MHITHSHADTVVHVYTRGVTHIDIASIDVVTVVSVVLRIQPHTSALG